MELNDIRFQRMNGGMGRPAPNEDVNSGLLLSLNVDLGNNNFEELALNRFNSIVGTELKVIELNYYEQLLLDFGIQTTKPTTENPALTTAEFAKNTIDYHVREFFRMSPTGKLWLAIKNEIPEEITDPTFEVTGDEIISLQNYANGAIRQIGIFTPTLTTDRVSEYQIACTGEVGNPGLEQLHKPLSLVVTFSGQESTLATMPNFVTDGYKNVSLLIGCDLSADIINLLGVQGNLSINNFINYGCIGNCIGAISAAKVNESIAWVGRFPLSLGVAGFITGDLFKETPVSRLNTLNENRYIFVRTITGAASNYYNDSHALDVSTSDYAFIKNNRTMDKATREIRRNLLPFLNSSVAVNAETGHLSADTVAVLENECNRALENMTKAGELSGYRCEINPEQNVLARSEIEIQIKNVPTGVVRNMVVKIGFTTNLS